MASNSGQKTMSSRLLTMKFMQRTASSSPSSTPRTPEQPPSKRQRLSNGSALSTPGSTPRSDIQAVEDVLAAEEQRRQEALDREAADRGETKWYLNFQDAQAPQVKTPLRIVSAGYNAIDTAGTTQDRSSEDEEEDMARPKVVGRRSFGKFNKTIERQQNPDASSSNDDSESESDSDPDDSDASDDPTGAKALIAQSRRDAGEKARAERKAQRKAEKAEQAKLADERRKKQIKLNNSLPATGGISSGGGGNRPDAKDMECFKCGKKGHAKKDCPSGGAGKGRKR